VSSLSLLRAMNSLYIGQVGAMCASYFAAYHRRLRGIVPGFDWFFRWIRRSEGGMLCSCSV